eukprot:CAMPEP_0174238320 /NCGR_PEP_ID=MMETSP0417-20130205/10982_1 /TAXON_ID=242541 /ORGANISM="Mayorella sp, Strain BSH-02190019" /LENGTH=113 /DNA_ID=CAMNT_0015317145 /DNA_START=1 /DNA_END=342 /DNA_ORIENTATION=+
MNPELAKRLKAARARRRDDGGQSECEREYDAVAKAFVDRVRSVGGEHLEVFVGIGSPLRNEFEYSTRSEETYDVKIRLILDPLDIDCKQMTSILSQHAHQDDLYRDLYRYLPG